MMIRLVILVVKMLYGKMSARSQEYHWHRITNLSSAYSGSVYKINIGLLRLIIVIAMLDAQFSQVQQSDLP